MANTKPRTAAVHRAAVTHTRSNTARSAIIASCLEMNACGLNQGTSGNISMRVGNQMIITPSAVPYDELQPAMLASLKLDAADAEFSGPLAPSSEWRVHADILRARPEVNAVVHAHPAVLHKPGDSAYGNPSSALYGCSVRWQQRALRWLSYLWNRCACACLWCRPCVSAARV